MMTNHHSGNRTTGAYLRFVAMVATSTVAMFCLTYLTTYQWSHVHFSETRAYMALIMGAAMASVMLAFMLHMLSDTRKNLAVVAIAAIVAAGAWWLMRSQRTVEDLSWMRAMIPHHSIAILTSERAQISDSRVRDLANRIVETQRSEIAEMEALIADLEDR